MRQLVNLISLSLLGCGGLSVDSKLIKKDEGPSGDDTGVEGPNDGPPVISEVLLTPDPAFTNDLLTAEVAVSNGNASLSYEWHTVNVPGDGADRSRQGALRLS